MSVLIILGKTQTSTNSQAASSRDDRSPENEQINKHI